MTPEEKTIIENSLKYCIWQVLSLQMEMELLQMEFAGLSDLASKLGDYTTDKILPEAERDLKYDGLCQKYFEQTSRYRAAANEVHQIFLKKGEAAQSMLESIDEYRKALGIFSETPLAGRDLSDPDNWDEIITGFEGLDN